MIGGKGNRRSASEANSNIQDRWSGKRESAERLPSKRPDAGELNPAKAGWNGVSYIKWPRHSWLLEIVMQCNIGFNIL